MSEEIRVSNRFGGLNVEEYMEEQVEESGNREENKENENTTNMFLEERAKRLGMNSRLERMRTERTYNQLDWVQKIRRLAT